MSALIIIVFLLLFFSKSNEGKSYRCTITVVGKSIQVSAVGKTYKAAKNAAARRALRRLNEK